MIPVVINIIILLVNKMEILIKDEYSDICQKLVGNHSLYNFHYLFVLNL